MSRQSWVAAALTRIGTSGVAGLAVEPLAAELGTTKGSFYWHFASRDDLLLAALEHWEQIATAEVIDETEQHRPDAQVEKLIAEVFAEHDSDRAEWMILTATDQEQVRGVVARVHRARLDYIRSLYQRAGLDADQATARAHLAYATYLGALQLRFTLDRPPETDSVTTAALNLLGRPTAHS